ncbi:fumarylacetoacetate hydrolase family protein [Actinoplanes sp. NPDC051494]|uniref:fumarylacetoacetate hydrolase family protein n=1 Tax=Actinoplanes sp. NPDC051494 TaxID=3363907 RepID=UPI0037AF036B
MTSSNSNRRRKALALTGIVAAGLAVAGLGSYGVVRTVPAKFPVVYSEQIPPGTTERVAIADPATALTFARVDSGSGSRVLAVTAYEKGAIRGVELGASFTEPIAAFNKLGYQAIQAIAGDPARPQVTVPATDTLTSLDTHSHHVGTGTNYKEHQAEASIEEPFVFPKIATLTDSHSLLPAGSHGLLDYEVELGIVALNDITAATGTPQHVGLVLSNDWTDRELLTEQIEPDNLTGGAGFTNAKSQPGFLSTGDLFVIPADWQTYYKSLQLDLFVNDDLRQRANPADLIWDVPTMIDKTIAAGDRSWDSDGVPTTLTAKPGMIPQGTILQTGTPEGVVYRAPDTRQRFLGFMEWAGSLGTNADSVVDSALKVYVRDAKNADVYLKPGDTIVTRADGLGQIFTTITAGQRAETE